MLLATAGKLFISAWYTSGFHCSPRGLNELDRPASSMDFVSRVLSLSREHGPVAARGAPEGGVDCGKGGGWVVDEEGPTRGRARSNRRKETNAGGWKGRALEETKGVFLSRRNGENSFLLPPPCTRAQPPGAPLCPRSPRINVARHAAKNGVGWPAR